MSTHEARWALQRMLTEWRDAAAPVEDVADCIEGLISAKVDEIFQAREDIRGALQHSGEQT